MDINRLLYNHQLAKLQDQHTGHDEASLNLIGHYAQRITAWRKADGLPAAGWPKDTRTCG